MAAVFALVGAALSLCMTPSGELLTTLGSVPVSARVPTNPAFHRLMKSYNFTHCNRTHELKTRWNKDGDDPNIIIIRL
jgi:hypothetical protein